mgnify:CR=1 FL=1
MQRIFRTVKKKKNLRRLSAGWLLLIAIELLCPAFSHERSLVAAVNPPQPETVVSATAARESEGGENSLSVSDSQNQNDRGQAVCNDECLCHATAIPNLVVPPVEPLPFPDERVAFLSGKFAYNALPPPYIPPKRS